MYITREQIQQAILDPEWQRLRQSLLGTSTHYKLTKVYTYLQQHPTSYTVKVQVQNYINALRRGGLIKQPTNARRD